MEDNRFTDNRISKKKERKNPSRETCESAIQRILFTEIASNGANTHFKKAGDFMPYFESLYIPSPALTKQVQRAVNHLNFPKDENGFYIIGKTEIQIESENSIRDLLEGSSVTITSSEIPSVLFLQLPVDLIDIVSRKLLANPFIKKQIITVVKSIDGILIFTENPDELKVYLNDFIELSED
ncbi:MAG: hypothetical protein K6E13_05740 [Lachnospiraceae bacterium]|nr:hypothetical protein [Lachnospiraceae bacterium]